MDPAIRDFLRDVVRPAIHPCHAPLAVSAHHLHGEPVSFSEAIRGDFQPFEVGEAWGGMWDTTWFRFRGEVPASWEGAERCALIHLGGDRHVGFSAEGLIYDSGGHPIQGLHHFHRAYLIGPTEQVDFYVEAAANPIPPWKGADWPLLTPDYSGAPMYKLEQAELATIDREVEGLYRDLRVAAELVSGEECVRRALELIDPADVAGSASAARAELVPVFAGGGSAHLVTAVGHAHIDSAWLWPLRETVRKCARTFSNQLRLMERYPEHHFVCSQAVQYQWMKDHYPSIYEQIRSRVAEGRWEPVGGMWVEPDSNLPSGESLVRQLIHGKRFFKDEFGVESHELWIPDVFGYTAALPQIAQGAGVTSLITQKLSWNDTNQFPHSTFWWEGHDGSRILAHFPPANTYNGEMTPNEVANSQTNFKEHGKLDRSVYPFGYGDGGGGPTAEMLENARRLADVEGLPRVTIDQVGRWLDDTAREAHDLATWTGELYLELHRGTYTTHADVKLGNRRGEQALREAEMWSVAAGIDRREELDAAWKLLLLNQFHDILPGTSIHWVYEDTRRHHAEVLRVASEVIEESQRALAGPGDRMIAFNPSSYDRTELVDVGGEPVMTTVPACGWAPVQSIAVPPVQVGDGWMDNGVVRVEWDDDGLVSSVWDHEERREVLAGKGNLFQLHEDYPKYWDGWDVDREYLDHCEDLTSVESIEVEERGPLLATIRVVRRFADSTIDQVMRLTAQSRRLEFETEVDWQERHRFLKVAFPVQIRTMYATYEIQHGFVQRPTVVNTSWDEARFEVCAHRWADLSETGYGVALLNDCKYGYDIRRNVMRLSLLRGPGYPDPEADRGRHRFAYALLPHQGESLEEVIREAEAFNLPLRIVAGGQAGQLVTVDRSGVSVEAVKWAEDGDGVVVRVCEVAGARGPVRVVLRRPWNEVSRVDLLERPLERVARDGRSARFELRPFELVTLRFS